MKRLATEKLLERMDSQQEWMVVSQKVSCDCS
jgi:hypothetical protein